MMERTFLGGKMYEPTRVKVRVRTDGTRVRVRVKLALGRYYWYVLVGIGNLGIFMLSFDTFYFFIWEGRCARA